MSQLDRLWVVIQAGGRSSRMERDKALVPLDGKPMIQHVIDAVGPLGDEVLVTTNTPDAYAFLGVQMASDATPGAGALPGLLTALQAAKAEMVALVACDMPFINRALMAHLVEQAVVVDLVVPRWDDRFQPMHAVYRRSTCLPAVRDALADGKRRMISFYDAIKVRSISEEEVTRFSPDGLTFFNVNTPTDLAQAERMLRP